VPLFGAVPGPERADALFAALEATAVPAGDGLAIPSVPVDDPAYDAARYWRGPVWPVLNWLFLQAARRSGRLQLADAIRRGLLSLVRAEGFREHYDARTHAGQGGEDFSWTAALVLDLLVEPRDAARADKRTEGRGA
jgi:glycogen debranching enzyme